MHVIKPSVSLALISSITALYYILQVPLNTEWAVVTLVMFAIFLVVSYYEGYNEQLGKSALIFVFLRCVSSFILGVAISQSGFNIFDYIALTALLIGITITFLISLRDGTSAAKLVN